MAVSLKKNDDEGEMYPQKLVICPSSTELKIKELEERLEKYEQKGKIIKKIKEFFENYKMNFLFVLLLLVLVIPVNAQIIYGFTAVSTPTSLAKEMREINNHLFGENAKKSDDWGYMDIVQWESTTCQVKPVKGFSNPNRYQITYDDVSFQMALLNEDIPAGEYEAYLVTVKDKHRHILRAINIPEVFGTTNEDFEKQISRMNAYYNGNIAAETNHIYTEIFTNESYIIYYALLILAIIVYNLLISAFLYSFWYKHTYC